MAQRASRRRLNERFDTRPRAIELQELPDPASGIAAEPFTAVVDTEVQVSHVGRFTSRAVFLNIDFAPFGTEADSQKASVIAATQREWVAWIRGRCGLEAVSCSRDERARRAHLDEQLKKLRKPSRRLGDRQLQLAAEGRHDAALGVWLERHALVESVATITMHADVESGGRRSSASHAVYVLVLQVWALLRRRGVVDGSPAKILRAVYSHLADCDAFMQTELQAFRSWRYRRGLNNEDAILDVCARPPRDATPI